MARTAFTVCKAVMMARPSIRPSKRGPFSSARPNKSAQISIAHSADGKFHYGSSFILRSGDDALLRVASLSDAYSSPCGDERGCEFALVVARTCLPEQIQLKFNISRKYLKISSGRVQLAGVAFLRWMSPLAASKEFNKADLRRCGDHQERVRLHPGAPSSHFAARSDETINIWSESSAQRLTFYAL
jgi:hypothetical protein